MIKVFYHKPDLDGHASGALVKYLIENNLVKESHNIICDDEVILKPADYADIFPIDELNSDDVVILVDFSLPYEDMIKLKSSVKRLIWIDHHKSSLDELEELNTEGYRDVSTAACQIVLDYFAKPETTSKNWKIIEWLGLYDSWKWEKHQDGLDILAFQYGMRLNHTDPFDNHYFWNVLFNAILHDEETNKFFIANTTKAGRNIIKYQQQFDKDYIKHFGFETKLEGHSTFAMNKGRSSSQSFGDLIDKYDLCLTFTYNGSKYLMSIYSKKIDASVIAKKYGGGGHPGAAGFEAKYMDIVNNEKILFYNNISELAK